MTIALEMTRSGKVGIWEKGGCSGNTGIVRLVAGKYAEACAPIFIMNNPARNGKQALYLIRPDFLVIDIRRENGRITVRLHKIVEINTATITAAAEEVATLVFTDEDTAVKDEALLERYPKLQEAITAGIAKSHHEHCKIPYYYEERRDRKCRV